MLQASAELTGGGVSPVTVLRARPAAAGEPSRTRSDDGREPEDADPYQRHADEEELQSEPSESSEEDELSDEDGDGALPHQPLLLLQHSGGRQQKKKTPKADRIGIAPRSLVELGKLKPEEILNAESTFASAEHCAFVLKELAVRLQTPGCLSITMRRGQSGQCVSVTCSCSGGMSTACKFDVHFKPRKESKSKVEHDQPDAAVWYVHKLGSDGHTCLRERPEATNGDNDAQLKQVRAASRRRWATVPLLLAARAARALITAFTLTCTRAGTCACWWCAVARAAEETAEPVQLHRHPAHRVEELECQPKCVRRAPARAMQAGVAVSCSVWGGAVSLRGRRRRALPLLPPLLPSSPQHSSHP